MSLYNLCSEQVCKPENFHHSTQYPVWRQIQLSRIIYNTVREMEGDSTNIFHTTVHKSSLDETWSLLVTLKKQEKGWNSMYLPGLFLWPLSCQCMKVYKWGVFFKLTGCKTLHLGSAGRNCLREDTWLSVCNILETPYGRVKYRYIRRNTGIFI